MAKYSGKTFAVPRSAEEISEKFNNLTALRPMLDRLPEEERAKVGDIELEADSVAVNTPQIGKIKFRVVENTPKKVVMKAEGTPVPMALDIDLASTSPTSTDATCSVDVEIPAMLRPFIGPQINKAVEMLSQVIEKAIG